MIFPGKLELLWAIGSITTVLHHLMIDSDLTDVYLFIIYLTLSFIWSRVSVHLTNVSPIFNLF